MSTKRLRVTGMAVMTSLLALHARDARASCVPGFDYAVFADGQLSLENHGDTDSFNSAVASYAGGGCGGNLGTNSTSSGAATLQNNATICGTITTGAGGTVSTSGSASFTGPAATLSAPVVLTTPTMPTLPTGGTSSFSSGTHALAPGYSYTGGIRCSGSHTVIQLSAGTYRTTDIAMDHCAIEVTSGPVILYMNGLLDIHTQATINAPSASGLPTNLVILSSGTEDNHVYIGAQIYAGIYAPRAAFHIEQLSDVYGAIVSGSYHGENHSEIHYDQAMASLGAGPFACTANEVSRASPIVATIGGSAAVVQGTFVPPTGTRKTIATTADITGFVFPYITGHMRARTAASITTTASAFSSGTTLFDAGASGNIPTVNNAGCTTFRGLCRNVFTNTNSIPASGRTFHPTRVQLNDSTASTVGALIAPTSAVSGIGAAGWQAIVRKVLAGGLGGVDRSTVAVIGPSVLAGSGARPTIAYFGADDGMIHAVCASTGGTTASVIAPNTVCPSLGKELWAFLPGTQLPLIRTNAQRIDGSVQVADMFGDFTNDPATGARSWHTVLTFQTGFAIGGKPGAYALDVTDPANPIILWEYSTPTSPAALDFGSGMMMAMGSTHIAGQLTNLAVAETNNGGTGGAGVVATALAAETGTKLWQFTYAFPATPRGGSGNLPYPSTGIPGSAVGVDLVGAGDITDLVFGDLYGNVWRLAATTGASYTGATTPLFSFTTDKHPIGTRPAIYKSGGRQYAAFASGGFNDPTATVWTLPNQYLISVRLEPTGSSFPIRETTSPCATCNLMLATTLTGSKGFAQALVVGSQLFVTSDSADVNAASYGTGATSTGTLTTVNLTTLAVASTAIRSGAAAIASVGTELFTSSSDQQQRLGASATSTTGSTVDITSLARITRLLWLRTE